MSRVIRHLVLSGFAAALLFTGAAHAERGRTAAIKAGIAADLNAQGHFPPNAMVSPYTATDVRMRSRASAPTPSGAPTRAVTFSARQVSGRATATRTRGPGGPSTTILTWRVQVDPASVKTPWTPWNPLPVPAAQ